MRVASGLSETEFASKLNVDIKTFQKIEKGIKLPEDIYAFEQDLRQVVKEWIRFKRFSA
jgi:DNA-binding transcriptional regulator YiaG